MQRFSMTDLRDKALLALDEAYLEAQKKPVPKSHSLRFTLAFLAGFCEERDPFDFFWREATTAARDDTYASQFGRRQSLRNAHAVIYRSLGLEPRLP